MTPPSSTTRSTHATQEVERLARLVDDLLFLAWSDEGTQLPTEDTPLRPLLAEAIAATRTQAAPRGVEMKLELGANLRACIAPALIHQAVVNLLTNAIRHSPSGGVVILGARLEGSTLVIEVLDEGPGFADEFLSDAFERFRRADESRTRTDGGTGLGLAIVRVVARAHGGTAEAATRPEGGAVVTVRVPSRDVKPHISPTRPS